MRKDEQKTTLLYCSEQFSFGGPLHAPPLKAKAVQQAGPTLSRRQLTLVVVVGVAQPTPASYQNTHASF